MFRSPYIKATSIYSATCLLEILDYLSTYSKRNQESNHILISLTILIIECLIHFHLHVSCVVRIGEFKTCDETNRKEEYISED